MRTGSDRPLRVLIVPQVRWSPYWNSFVPGSGPDPFLIYNRLRELGIETSIVDPAKRPWNPFSGGGSLLEGLDPIRAFRVLTRERRCDLVVSVFESPAVPLVLLRRFLDYRPNIALWDLGLADNSRLRQIYLDLVVPRVNGIMVLGSNQKSLIESRWRVKCRIEVVHHHVDTDFFRPLPVAADGPILSVGDDVGRDYDCLARAMVGVKASILIKTKRELSAMPRNCTIFKDRLSYVDLRAMYARSPLFVVPLIDTANASGVGTVLEAMAMAKPLIVSDSSGIRDFIVPDKTCLVVPVGDHFALRAAIDRLTADRGLAANLGEGARHHVVERFSKPRFTDGLARAIRNIADPTKPA